MKSIDIKSLIIGVLLASTVFFGMAANYSIIGENELHPSRGAAFQPIQVELTLINGDGKRGHKFEF